MTYIIGDFSNVYLDFVTSPFLLYFAIGLLLGKYHELIREKISSFVEPLLFIVLYVFFIVMIAKDSGYFYEGMPRESVVYNGKEIPRILIWGVPSFILLISYFALASKYKITNTYLSKLGDRSYSIYLLQIFFIYLLYEVSFEFSRSEKIWLSMLMIVILVGQQKHEDEFQLSKKIISIYGNRVSSLHFKFIDTLTRGQSETACLAKHLVDLSQPLLIFNIDTQFSSSTLEKKPAEEKY